MSALYTRMISLELFNSIVQAAQQQQRVRRLSFFRRVHKRHLNSKFVFIYPDCCIFRGRVCMRCIPLLISAPPSCCCSRHSSPCQTCPCWRVLRLRPRMVADDVIVASRLNRSHNTWQMRWFTRHFLTNRWFVGHCDRHANSFHPGLAVGSIAAPHIRHCCSLHPGSTRPAGIFLPIYRHISGPFGESTRAAAWWFAVATIAALQCWKIEDRSDFASSSAGLPPSLNY